MHYCDICGAPIDGEPYVIKLDNAVLHVCERCARSYGGTVKVESPPKRLVQPQQRRITKRGAEPRYEVVEEYAEVIKRARESLGLSREALASYIGVKESVLKRIESGQLMPDIELARKLEKALGVKLLEPVQQAEDQSGGYNRRELTLGDVAELRDEE
ncbi:multiprotein bridging factor aMBF1 [Thermoproteus tenax]|uniref:Multprotein bridging factor n=2 Tax=Thermoproteus tenax TaxID=2271 RepID=G4RLV7_THETK|nr:multiprotein bridging factor aMBF1 [Thermoproteus tenax]CBZ41801.1 multiprotein bridging factor [Thermoproteus tenax]CCC82552.1 Multprotein bridging factor [Thermoproteus tenax Kra 1]